MTKINESPLIRRPSTVATSQSRQDIASLPTEIFGNQRIASVSLEACHLYLARPVDSAELKASAAIADEISALLRQNNLVRVERAIALN